MECTQKLECTQDLNPEPYLQRSGPEQIGYLGILGNTFPVNHGPNKIGRDPQTCSIVLDMKSLSRQHAVINVLNKKQFMLMDLGSINKTKIGVKTLQPYIPYPLQNGDTIQFGDVFGIFRLFEDDTDLPMTQDIGVPDTPPVFFRQVSKLGASTSSVATIVPESPDVSDKDDSFIVSSQQTKEPEFKSPKNRFLKPSARIIMKPSIGTNQINNDFWNSAEKSPSLKLNLDDSGESLNDSSSSEINTIKAVVSNNNTAKDIHEMETQVPYGNYANETAESIYTANTQLPPSNSPSIHSLETQLQLPVVRKINEQHEMQFELSIDNKENDVSVHNAHTQMFEINDIYNAETQAMSSKKNESIHNANTQLFEDKEIYRAETEAITNKSKEKCIHEMNTQLIVNTDNETSVHDVDTQMFNNHNKIKNQVEAIEEDNSFCKKESIINSIMDEEKISESDEELLFGEFDNKDLEIEISFDKKGSTDKEKHKPKEKRRSSNDLILLDEADDHQFDNNIDSQPLLLEMSPNKSSDKENMPITNSESSSPIIGAKRNKMRIDSGSSSDCDDLAILPTQKILANTDGDDDETDCEDMIFNKLEPKNDQGSSVPNEVNIQIRHEEMATQILDEKIDETCFEDMPTQIINEDQTESDLNEINSETNKLKADSYEDMPTQIIIGDVPNENEPTFSAEVVSPFKIPFLSPKKIRKKDVSKLTTKSMSCNPISNPAFTSENKDENDDKYYEDTQDILDDLYSQRISSPKRSNSGKDFKEDDEVVPCSVEDFEVGDRFRHIENQVSPQKSLVVADRSSIDSIDSAEQVDKYVSNLSSNQIKDIVGVGDKSVSTLIKKSSSDLSDLEVTPKKYNPLKFMNIELPNSQEIKTNVTWSKSAKTESSSDSDPDTQDSQECTPILFKKKVRAKKADAKMDLISKFNADALPTRVITRVRKPTAKVQEYTEGIKKVTETILKPKYLTEQEDNIDKDIITENITRLQNKKNKSVAKAKSPSDRGTQSVKIDTQDKPSNDSVDEKIKDTKQNRKSAEKKTAAEKSVSKHAKNDTSDNEYKSHDKGQSKKIEISSGKITTLYDNDICDKKRISRETKENPKNSVEKGDNKVMPKNDTSSNGNESKRSNDIGQSKKGEKSTSKTTTSYNNDICDNKSKSRVTKENAKKLVEKENNKVTSKRTEDDKQSQSKISDFYEKEQPKEERRSRSKRGDNKTRSSNELNKRKNEKSDTKSTLESKEIEEIINLDSEPEDTKKTSNARSTRSTRNKNKTEGKSKSPEKSKKPNKPKYTKQAKKSASPPPPPENTNQIRRSKRQKFSKDSQDSQNDSQNEKTARPKIKSSKDPETKPKSSLTRDQSTIYNISAESNPESPKSRKRTATEHFEESIPKRTRSALSNTSIVSRATPAKTIKTLHVLFTAFQHEDVKTKLENLGAVVVTDVNACSVLVTLQIKRTFKLLCIVGLGKPIVGPSWVQACVDTNMLVDPWLYLMRDEAAETRFHFNLERTLTGPRAFLQGYNVSSTPSVMPQAAEMKLIVESSGGTWKEGGPQWICVSTSSDKSLWASLRRRGAILVSTELILGGVLRQKLDIEANKLRLVKNTEPLSEHIPRSVRYAIRDIMRQN